MRRWICLACLLLPWPRVQAEPGVVLHQVHQFSAQPVPDTLRAYITAKQVRIAHASGDAILDLREGRLVLLDRRERTWRQMSLEDWEKALRQAVEMQTERDSSRTGNAPVVPPAFQRAGVPSERAGYLCDRWSFYSRRELIPGEVDWVEQQIWVARDLTMPPGAYEAYDRATRAIDSIGMGALVQRPDGVVMATEIRTGSVMQHEKGGVEVERLTVYKVENIDLADSVFAIPASYQPAGSQR